MVLIKYHKVQQKGTTTKREVLIISSFAERYFIFQLVRVQYGGPWLTNPELLFKRKSIIPVLQFLLSNQSPKPAGEKLQ